jgi:outer membrane protein assembly factor BamB
MEQQKNSRFFAARAPSLYAGARAVAFCAVVFCLVIAVLLAANYVRTQSADALNLGALKVLREQLHSQPGSAELQREIREVDRLARQAFFSSTRFSELGAGLLLGWTAILLICLRIMAGLRPRLPDPGKFRGLLDLSAELQRARLAFAAAGLALSAAAIWVGVPRPQPDSAAAAVSAARAVSPAVPAPWPAFRGPGGNAIAKGTNYPTRWDGAAGSGVVWKTAIPLAGTSSPIVAGGHIFLTGASKEVRQVYCFDAGSGSLLWTHDVTGVPGGPAAPPDVSEDTGFAAPTMAAAGDRVFAMFATGELVALNHNGQRQWARAFGVPENHYGHSSSLLAYEDTLFVQFDHAKAARVYGVDVATGRDRWSTQRKEIAWSSPVCVDTGGRRELILMNSTGVDSYDPRNGAPLWGLRCLSAEVGTSPAYENGMVFAGNQYTVMCGISIHGSNGQAAVTWTFDEDLPEVASPLALGGRVFVATSEGALACLDGKTGKPQWRHEFNDGFWASPIAAGNTIYALDRKGVMQVFEAGAKWQPIAACPLGEKSTITPAFADGRIYLRGEKSLFCVQ